jgi:hypothetical protein
MSTLAIDGPETVADGENRAAAPPAAKRGAPALLKNFDLVVLAIGVPVVLLADLPVLGYAVGAAAWIAQRLLFVYGQRRTRAALRSGDRRAALGWTGFATLGRVWLVTISVLLVGLLGARADGLTAAVLSAILVTVFLIGQAVDRVLGGESAAPGAGPSSEVSS